MGFLSTRDDLAVERALAAMAAYPDLAQASAYLAEQGYQANVDLLRTMRDVQFRDRFEKVRDSLAPRIEASLANDFLDNARMAAEVERMAVERTRQMLEEGKIAEPSRVARDLSQVKTQSVDKRLALQGRPTQITEHRDPREIVRALEAMRVVQTVDATVVPELGEADGSEPHVDSAAA